MRTSLYIHWPFCKAKCPYCDFNSHVRESVEAKQWELGLIKEMRYWAQQTGKRPLQSIFFGGGTPSLMPPSTVEALIQEAKNLWGFSDGCEITLEANPTSSEAAKFTGFRAAGINRLSMGIQALRENDLRFLGREHSITEALHAFEAASNIFDRTSFDLIYARPEQTLTDWEQELQEALRYAGTHLSLYQLTIEPATPFFYRHEKGELRTPDEEISADLYSLTQTIMESAGMPAYEISNHAKPGDECRHNLAYWRSDDYIGIGAGAHGRVTLSFPCERGELEGESTISTTTNNTRYATQNIRSPEKWLEQVNNTSHGTLESTILTPQERVEEWLLMGLRLQEGVCINDFRDRWNFDPTPFLNQKNLERYRIQGLLACKTQWHISTTPSGRLLTNSIIGELLSH